jgi:hypothetical protein
MHRREASESDGRHSPSRKGADGACVTS